MKMSDAEIQSIVEVVEKRLKEQQNEEEVKELEEAPIFPTKAQYPLKGFKFYIPPIYYEANFDELDLYSPLSIMEVDDYHKRRRKKLEHTHLFMSLDKDTWDTLRAETKRTKSGYTSATIKKIVDDNVTLKEENERLYKMIVDLIQKEVL